MDVGVCVGPGVKVSVGSGVCVDSSTGKEAANVSVAELLADRAIDSAVKATTVGRYSGG